VNIVRPGVGGNLFKTEDGKPFIYTTKPGEVESLLKLKEGKGAYTYTLTPGQVKGLKNHVDAQLFGTYRNQADVARARELARQLALKGSHDATTLNRLIQQDRKSKSVREMLRRAKERALQDNKTEVADQIQRVIDTLPEKRDE